MAQNLRNRLQQIRKNKERPEGKRTGKNDQPFKSEAWPGWTEAGFKTLKREIKQKLSSPVPDDFPKALALLVPDFARSGMLPLPHDLCFFDLETTGLSGGAGTVAFLAAFGRFAVPSGNVNKSNAKLAITQYLLLDYSGESDFIEKAVKEFSSPSGKANSLPFVVSYNGKSFDSQILKNRCLMNGIMNPEYFHADLLHPARRLWRNKLTDCSQATIETSVLGLDRKGDVPGALAPEIWFDFLRKNENSQLLSVCEHNAKDITGLSSLFLALAEISSDPLKGAEKFSLDEEALAFSWKKSLRNNQQFFSDTASRDSYAKTGNLLLEAAARNGSPKAAITLAIDAEWRLKDLSLALAHTERALAFPEISDSLKDGLEKRHARLMKKTNTAGG